MKPFTVNIELIVATGNNFRSLECDRIASRNQLVSNSYCIHSNRVPDSTVSYGFLPHHHVSLLNIVQVVQMILSVYDIGQFVIKVATENFIAIVWYGIPTSHTIVHSLKAYMMNIYSFPYRMDKKNMWAKFPIGILRSCSFGHDIDSIIFAWIFMNIIISGRSRFCSFKTRPIEIIVFNRANHAKNDFVHDFFHLVNFA